MTQTTNITTATATTELSTIPANKRKVISVPVTPPYIDLNAQAARVHEANAKWWWDLSKPPTPVGVYPKLTNRNVLVMGMLAKSELAEALEAFRKNLNDDKLPQYPGAVVELADCVIRLLDTIAGHGIRIEQSVYDEHQPELIGNTLNFGEELFSIDETITTLFNNLFLLTNPALENARRERGKRATTDVACDTAYLVARCYELSTVFYPEDSCKFWDVYEAKMQYNAERPDHKIEHWLSEHGKKI